MSAQVDGPPSLDAGRFATIRVEERGSTLLIVLDRPEVRNAANLAMATGLAEVLAELDERADLAIVDNPMLNGETIRLDGAIRMTPR